MKSPHSLLHYSEYCNYYTKGLTVLLEYLHLTVTGSATTDVSLDMINYNGLINGVMKYTLAMFGIYVYLVWPL